MSVAWIRPRLSWGMCGGHWVMCCCWRCCCLCCCYCCRVCCCLCCCRGLWGCCRGLRGCHCGHCGGRWMRCRGLSWGVGCSCLSGLTTWELLRFLRLPSSQLIAPDDPQGLSVTPEHALCAHMVGVAYLTVRKVKLTRKVSMLIGFFW